ncbi:MAG TPA: SpaA isopeptide-forming pilin-related protein, partial [Pirellulales bacterium]|nr:SpaA isopeptide-forming pilin-related protein [Pirellulales bacterium]
IVRHEIDVTLPAPQTIELAVTGPLGSWQASDSQVSLYPFPNRKTDYRLSLLNNGPTDRSVDLELLALDRKATVVPPAAALTPDDAADLLKRFGPLRLVAALPKIALPAGGRAVPLPFPLPAAPKPGEAPAAEALPPAASTSASPSASPAAAAPPASSPGSAAKGKPPSDEPPPPPRPVLDRGLLAIVTDRESGLKTIIRVDIEPQRPRRYVRPQVGYSLDQETLRIRVTPQNLSLLPADGVRVHAEIGVPLPAGTQAQLDGELKAPDYVANLFCELPADSAKVVPVRINVDGYPRAFVYRVPLGIQSTDLAEETDLRDVRITSPEPEAAYKAPVESILVEAQVDAPLGAFQNPDDVVEVGIDVDRDRDLRGNEPRVQLAADRQVSIWLDRAAPGGLFSLDTKVADFHLAVPTPPLQNARVSVLGRVFAGGKTGWGQPVDIFLDGTPPRVERVELKPPIIVAGQDVEVSVWATDDNLSGVVKVEVGFDTSGHGKFDDSAEAFELEHDSTGRWFSKLPTKTLQPGDLSLLVRTTDRAGNVSDYTKVKCHIVSKAEADAAKAAPLAKFTGNVVFGNDPAADVEMTLSSDKGPKIPPTKTDSSGNFKFTNLPPGKYKLTAKSVIHNKTRKIDQDVTVEPPGDEQPKPVKIVLK